MPLRFHEMRIIIITILIFILILVVFCQALLNPDFCSCDYKRPNIWSLQKKRFSTDLQANKELCCRFFRLWYWNFSYWKSVNSERIHFKYSKMPATFAHSEPSEIPIDFFFSILFCRLKMGTSIWIIILLSSVQLPSSFVTMLLVLFGCLFVYSVNSLKTGILCIPHK